MPIAQHTMIFLLDSTRRTTCSISLRESPVASRTSAHAICRGWAANSSKPVEWVVDELEVQHAAGGGVLGFQQKGIDRLEQRQVAARLDVQELVGDRGAPADDSAWLSEGS